MRLAAVDCGAATNESVYTVPTNRRAAVTLSLCNRTSEQLDVRVALAASGTPTNAEWIEYDALVPSGGGIERSGLLLGASQRIVVRAGATGISAVVWGVEEQV